MGRAGQGAALFLSPDRFRARQARPRNVLGRLVNAQVQLSRCPTPRLFYTMLAHVPLAGTGHLESGGIDHDMSMLSCWCRLRSRLQAGLATTHGRVCRHREVHFHQPDDGLEETLHRTQAEVEYHPHDQRALDGSVGTHPRPFSESPRRRARSEQPPRRPKRSGCPGGPAPCCRLAACEPDIER